ncbi:MAG: hypothetical protein FWG89_10260 [Treponema sp.]|nr:hypothetical protein [Treponema sp.]
MKRFMLCIPVITFLSAACVSLPPDNDELHPNDEVQLNNETRTNNETRANRVNNETQADVANAAVTATSTGEPESQQEIPEQERTELSNRTTHEIYYDPVAEADIRQALNNLSISIRNSNFPGWRTVLADDYFSQVTSAENLADLSNRPFLKTQNITLRTPQDYFIRVVVPSRTTWANSQLDDDIEFLSADHVRVYEQYTRHRVYELQRIDNQWKVTN